MSTERIDIVVAENGSRTVRRNLQDVGKAGGEAASGVGMLQKALLGLTVGAALLYLQRQADAYTNILNKLRLVTSGTENLTRVNNELFASANRTRSEYESTVDLYANLARSTKTLGLSQKDLLQITETVNQAIAISGTDAATAANGLRQLGQGLASGTLRGDELNSVLENMPRLASAIAEGMGKTVGQLRSLGAAGKITADNITSALKKAGPQIAEEFAKVNPTIAGSFTVLKNHMTKFIGDLDQATGISTAFAKTILAIAGHLDAIAVAAAGIGLAFAWSAATTAISATLGPMIALNKALGAGSTLSALYSIAMKAAQAATRGFTAALLANPFTALLVVLAAVIGAIVAFGDQVSVTADGAVSLKDAFFASLSFIMDFVKYVAAAVMVAWDAATSFVTSLFEGWGTSVSEVLSLVVAFVKGAVNKYIGMWKLAYDTVKLIWNNFPGFMNSLFVAAANFGAAAAETVLNAWQAPLRAIQAGLEWAGATDKAKGLGAALDGMSIHIPRMVASAAGKEFSDDLGAAVRDNMSRDFLGEGWDAVVKRARATGKAAAGTLDPGGDRTETAAAGKKKKGSKAETRAEYLAKVNRETQNSIDLARSMNFEWAKVDEDVVGVQEHLAEKHWAGLTPTEQANMRTQLKLMYDAQDMQERMLKAYEEFKAPQEDYEKGQTAINAVMAKFPQYAEQGRRALRDLRIEYLQTKTDLASGLELGRLNVQKDNENVGARAASAYQDEYKGATGAMQELQTRMQVLQQLMHDDPINSGHYAQRIREVNLEALQLKTSLPGANVFDAMRGGLAAFAADFKGILPGLQSAFGDFFSKFAEGAANSIGRAIVYGEDFGDAMREVARSAIAELIGAIIKLGIQWLLTQILGNAMMSAQVAASSAAGVATAAAWAPAATMVSLATFGANAIPAGIGIASISALTTALSMVHLADGGLVHGPGGPRDDRVPAMLSNKEFVVNADATGRYLPLLQAINSGSMLRFAMGGQVGGQRTTQAPSFAYAPSQQQRGGGGGGEGDRSMKVTIEDHVGTRFQVDRVSRDEVRIIARDAVRKEAPKVVARQLSDRRSTVTKSLKSNTTARPRVE